MIIILRVNNRDYYLLLILSIYQQHVNLKYLKYITIFQSFMHLLYNDEWPNGQTTEHYGHTKGNHN